MQELRSLADLLDLQAVDSEIDRLLHRRQSLPELEQYRVAHEAAQGIAARLETEEAELKQAELALDKSEGELGLLEQKLTQEERRLYAGGMNARETGNMQHEVESLRTRRTTMEEGVLELLDQRETLASDRRRQPHRVGGRSQARGDASRGRSPPSGRSSTSRSPPKRRARTTSPRWCPTRWRLSTSVSASVTRWRSHG